MVERVEVKKDKAKEWRWTAFAGNGDIVATSGEGYKNKQHALNQAGQMFPGVPVEATK